MAITLGTRSLQRLEGVDPRLVAVVKRAAAISSIDFTVIEGRRTKARQAELWAQGRTKPGPKVTWTMQSKHIDGKAVDIGPWVSGAIAWNRHDLFDALAKVMLQAAKDLGTPIRWGGNWDGDDKPHEKGETDSPHFELA